MSEWTPRLNPSVDLRRLPLSAEEGFVLSRMDGHTRARDLPALTGLPPERLRDILQRLVSHGALLPGAEAQAVRPEAPPEPGPSASRQAQGSVSVGTPRAEALGPGLASRPAQEGASVSATRTETPGPGSSASRPAQKGASALEPHAQAEATARSDDGPVLETEASDPLPGAEASDEDAAPEDDVPEAVLGDFRQLFETRLHAQPEDQRVALARGAEDPELSALCFDPVPAVIKAVLENPRVGLAHARLIARHHRNPVGLEALAARAAFAADVGVRRFLVRNPQLPVALFRRLWALRRLMEQHKLTVDRDVPEHTRRTARELLRQRFATGPSEEKAELILNTEGRALGSLVGMPVDGKTTSLLCGRTYRSPMLVQNLARWSAAPPALIAHLLKQELVRRQPQLRAMLARHPNAPADAKRS